MNLKNQKLSVKVKKRTKTKNNLKLIVGLGNPGPRYKKTRHNVGFLVIDEIARRHGLDFKEKNKALETKLDKAYLIKPTTFMNLSGEAVQSYESKYKIKPQEILLIHDDLDLPFGKMRIKLGGGAGGQKGVRDTIMCIGPDFIRLKLGIGRPPEKWKVENWVLSKFSKDEEPLLEKIIAVAADAVEAIMNDSLLDAMNEYSNKDLNKTEKTAEPSSEITKTEQD